ncbi:FecCD family ABC transporter permease [Kineococcus esterisolvens]|uniref:FecCD family ABC transporter permease n=1 Tax=unclassified Kineococcus TaxID=2621656 RepID=UPI003D7C36D7
MPATGAPARSSPPLPRDPLGRRARGRRGAVALTALAALTVAAALAGAAVGAAAVEPADVLRVVAHHLPGTRSPAVVPDPVVEAVVWDVRLPRVLLGLAVGAGLAVCGAALQAMVRNPLADPQLLGVSSGASTGAAAALLLGAGAGWGEHALSGSAFTGALAASVLVYAVARSAGQVTSARLLLSGVAVGYALHAATSFLVFASGSAEGARSVVFWLLGSLGLAAWGAPLAAVLVVVAATVTLLTAWGPRLDALAMGDETARGLGVSPAAFRTVLLAVVSLCVGVLVAASGTIGFVGLVVPHVARRLVGGAHRWSVPAAALLGAAFLVAADLLARTLLAPQELPIGIVTALAGCPFLLWLVRSTRTGA